MWNILTGSSACVIPAVVLICALIFLFSHKDSFAIFSRGAKNGIHTAIELIPSLSVMLCGVAMLRASGFLTLLSKLLSPIADLVGLPSELLPLLLTRPFSGSASLAIFEDLLKNLGADSFPSLCASVIMGSSDTVVYILTVYFSSIGIKRTRYAFPCAIAVMIFCIFFSCFVCRMMFN